MKMQSLRRANKIQTCNRFRRQSISYHYRVLDLHKITWWTHTLPARIAWAHIPKSLITYTTQYKRDRSTLVTCKTWTKGTTKMLRWAKTPSILKWMSDQSQVTLTRTNGRWATEGCIRASSKARWTTMWGISKVCRNNCRARKKRDSCQGFSNLPSSRQTTAIIKSTRA